MINCVKFNLEYNNSNIAFFAATSLILKKINSKIDILESIKFYIDIKPYNIYFITSIIINYKINVLKLCNLNICKINFFNLFDINHEINILNILKKRIEIYQQNLEYIMSFISSEKLKFSEKVKFQNLPEEILDNIEDCNNILDIIFEEKDLIKYSDILSNIEKVKVII